MDVVAKAAIFNRLWRASPTTTSLRASLLAAINITSPSTVSERRELTTSTVDCLPYYVRKTYLNKWGRRDIIRREKFAEYEFERDHLRLIKGTDFMPVAVKAKAAEDLAALPRDSCITRVRNRCTLTSRPRGNVVRYRISRIMFRELADKGLIAGYTRSSW